MSTSPPADDTAALVQGLFEQAENAHKAGRLGEAEQHYRRILDLDGRHADSLHGLGAIALDYGHADAAIALIARAIASRGDVARFHTALGAALERQGRIDEAITCHRRALALQPDYAAAHCNIGTCFGRIGRLEEAASAFTQALALNPEDAAAHHNLGFTREQQGRLTEALEAYERSLARRPDAASTLNSIGMVLFALMRPEEALAYTDRALALKPDYVDALNNRGAALMQLHRIEDALATYDRALALRPDHLPALDNRGTALMRLKRPDEAMASFERAIALKPDSAQSNWSQALCHLMRGELEQGFEKYEWRWRVKPQYARHYPMPLWRGREDLAGKSILIHAEQGFGDTLQFCRYVPLLAERGARVLLQIPEELKRLFASLEGVAELYVGGETPPATDVHCPLLSLPLAFKTGLDTVPARIPYLAVAPELKQKWREKLRGVARPRIGLAWSGRSEQMGELHRSIAPDGLAPLLGPGATLVSLQKVYRPEDAAWLRAHPAVLDFSADLEDFADTAALASQMDMIVTIDTSVAHLAGALGLPVWILLSYIGDWRWMQDRDDSPWYPTARLYRQTAVNDWTGAIERVATDLKARSR